MNYKNYSLKVQNVVSQLTHLKRRENEDYIAIIESKSYSMGVNPNLIKKILKVR